MKVKTINYQKVFPLAQYVNERIGVEIEISDGDDLDAAFKEAKDLVHEWADKKSQLHDSITEEEVLNAFHPINWVQTIPANGTVNASPSSTVSQTQPEERRIGDLASDIKSCTDVRVLETYRLLVQKKPEFKAIYDEMHKKLSPKPTKETNLKNK